jgi:hypothetical protein
MSFLAPERKFGSDVISDFCRYVRSFASAEAAAGWIEGHPGTFELSIEDGYRLGHLSNAAHVRQRPRPTSGQPGDLTRS